MLFQNTIGREIKGKGKGTFKEEKKEEREGKRKRVACPPKAGPVVMGVVQLVDPRERLLRKRHRPEQIVLILCDIQSDLDAGLSVDQALRKAGIGITTYYRWKARQQAPVSPESVRLRELESEVDRLKILVAELALDRRMLQEALKKKP
jgi:putative transposase